MKQVTMIFGVLLAMSLLVGCSGPEDGSNGYNSLVSFTENVEVPVELCPSGTGFDISTGLDINRNLILDEEEIVSTDVLCDGADGEDGEDGEDVYYQCRHRSHGHCRISRHYEE